MRAARPPLLALLLLVGLPGLAWADLASLRPHVVVEDEVVRRRPWLTREEFLDLLGATNLIPGPNSTEMAIHIGRLRAGWPGLLVAGGSFVLPASFRPPSTNGTSCVWKLLPG